MESVLQRMKECAIVPVVVLDDAKQAVPTANALLAGGIDVMEITFRTSAATESIQLVSEFCPDMLVGAGTVCNLEQCKTALEAGAKFIVSPGFNENLVRWCVEREIPVLPGCVTPTEIMAALELGLKVVKFFPANVFGGLTAMKSLSAPFGGIRFLPTGGVNVQNVGEFLSADFIQAVGGSWICSKTDIAAGSFDKITKLCLEARQAALEYEVVHVGINMPDENAAIGLAQQLNDAFGFPAKIGNSSVFSSARIEIMKSEYLGAKGHIAVCTNSVEAAAAELRKKGYSVLADTVKYKNGRMTVAYLEREFGGFAIHLIQR